MVTVVVTVATYVVAVVLAAWNVSTLRLVMCMKRDAAADATRAAQLVMEALQWSMSVYPATGVDIDRLERIVGDVRKLLGVEDPST